MVHLKFIMFFKCCPILKSPTSGLRPQLHFKPSFPNRMLNISVAQGGLPSGELTAEQVAIQREKAQTFFIISKYMSAWSFSTTEN